MPDGILRRARRGADDHAEGDREEARRVQGIRETVLTRGEVSTPEIAAAAADKAAKAAARKAAKVAKAAAATVAP